MSLVARGLAYLAALTLAFAGAAPWAMINGEPAVASPWQVALVWGLALVAVIATVAHQRRVLGMVAVLAAAVAVYAIWNLPGLDAVAVPPGQPRYTAASGSAPVLLMAGAVLLYLASWLPAPRETPTATADAQS